MDLWLGLPAGLRPAVWVYWLDPSFGYLTWELWLRSLVWDLWLGIFGLGSLVWDLWIGIFGLGSLVGLRF